ncbi:MAG: DUF4347 domain-containing protein, partial [Gammaproteobacteria bacterium]
MGKKVLKKKNSSDKANLIFEELEQRLLLSADGLAVIAESSIATTQELAPGDNDTNTLIVQNYAEQSSVVIQAKHHGSELVIIDSRAPNFQQLHNDIITAQQQGRDIQVVVLDAHRDGIEQISEALTRYNNLDAVHIVSHGNTGKLELGETQLDKQSLKQRTEEIKQWSGSFTQGGDLLLYGCNLASTANGQSLVDALAKQTGTDVAASDDLTGNNILGGDWDLEYRTGDIETSIAFTQDVQDNWQGVLNTNTASAAAEQTQVETPPAEEQVAEQTDPGVLLASEGESSSTSTVTATETQIQTQIERRQEIVFVDETVSDYQAFLDDIQLSNETTDYQVVLLDNASDGIEQISQILADHQNLDAVHIISHGIDGQVFLGNTSLITSTLDENSEQISTWGNALGAEGDLLFYGCNLAETEAGKSLIQGLSNLTGADVAASDDSTGHESLGADWDLEYQTGIIETGIVVSGEFQQNWLHELAVETYIDSFSSGSTLAGTTGSDASATQTWSTAWTAITPGVTTIASGVMTSARDFGMSSTSDYSRAVDLSTATSNVSLSYDVTNFGSTFSIAGDNIVIMVWDDLTIAGGGIDDTTGWVTLTATTGTTVNGTNIAAQTYTYNLTNTDYLTANSAIRFQFNHSSNNRASDWVSIDNVTVKYTTTNTAAPVLDNTGTMTLTNIAEDDTNPAGDTVAAIIATSTANSGNAITDADADSEGLAVIGTDNSNGTWQYSTNSGASWTAFGDLTASNNLATLLEANDMIRFVPAADYNGSAGDITFRAWDTSSGASGDTAVDVSSNGGTTAYSTATETATLTVTAIDDAPINTVPGAQSINEDTALSIAGISVADAEGNLASTQLSVTQGTVSVTLSGAATIGAGVNGSATLTITGTQADINATLASLSYQGNLNYNGADTLTVLSTDSTGTPLTDSDTVAITVNAVDDDALATNLSAVETYIEDTPLNLTDIVISDVDETDASITLTLSDAGAGSLNTGTSGGVTSTFVGGVWTATGAITDINILLAGLTFTP